MQVIRDRGGNVFSSSGGLDPHAQAEKPEGGDDDTVNH